MLKIIVFTVFISLSFLLPSAFGGAFFTDGFETGDLSHVDGSSGAKWNGQAASPGSSVTVSSEVVRSGTKALKVMFKGNADLTNDSYAEAYFNLGAQRQDVYIRFYIFYPANYIIRDDPAGPENTKLMYLWGSNYNTDMAKIGIEYEKDMHFGFKAKGEGYPLSPSCNAGAATGYIMAYPHSSTVSITSMKGRWAAVEVHYKLDSGSGDGVFQLWVDGTLEINAQNIIWASAPCAPGYLLNGYLMGWSNSGFSEDTSVYIDDVVFSDSYVGIGDAIADVCGASHLNLCTTQTPCLSAGGYWWADGSCHSSQEVITPPSSSVVLRGIGGVARKINGHLLGISQ